MGFVAALPFAVKAAAVVATSVAAGHALGKSSSKPPPVISQAPENQQIANKLPPVNFAQVYDTLSGNSLQIIRGVDGKMSVQFGGNGNKIPLDAPINTGSFSANLPAVRQIKMPPVVKEAASVIALSQAMQQLSGTIAQLEQTNPELIPQNQGLLNSFKQTQQMYIDRGFDIKQFDFDTKLAKAGLSLSSTALGVQVALAREKAQAQAQANLEYFGLAHNLKQDLLGNMFKRGDQMAQNAALELNRYNSETSNLLQERGQDIQADLAVQQLDQNRAITEADLNLRRNDQMINAEIARRQLESNERGRMATLGLDLINSGNQHALGARAIENQAISNVNTATQSRYALSSNPVSNAFNTGLGTFLGYSGAGIAGQMFGPAPDTKPLKSITGA